MVMDQERKFLQNQLRYHSHIYKAWETAILTMWKTLICSEILTNMASWKCHGYHSDIQNHGFVVHSEKSIIIRKQTSNCLGLIISSTSITLSVTDIKKTKIKELSKDILSCSIVNIRELTKPSRQSIYQFSCSKIWTVTLQVHRESKITGPNYRHNSFDKKVNILNDD